MAITAYPFDDTDTTEAQFSKLFRNLRSTGVLQSLTASSDMSAGQMIVSVSAGMVLNIGTGAAIIRGHYVEVTSTHAVTVPSAGSTNRVDAVVLRLDPANNVVTPMVITTSISYNDFDTWPTLTQTDAGNYDLLLALVRVPANSSSIIASNLLNNRIWAGKDVFYWRDYNAPGSSTQVRYAPGSLGYNIDQGVLQYWTGTTLKSVGQVNASDIVGASTMSVGYAANAGKIDGKKITVSKTQPSNPATGDVWISW